MTPERNFHKSYFRVDFEDRTLAGDVISKNSRPEVLILHGAGNADRKNFRLFRQELLNHEISSAAFDFVGHGDTGGELKCSSLISRTEQACSVVDSLNIEQPFSVIGASMGAYTAVKLLECYQIKNLVLIVPAMYDSKAYQVAFNKGFTEIIRRPQSWDHSDAWQILSEYKGRLFIIAAENDQVIPSGVVNRIYDSAVKAEKRTLYFAPQTSHAVLTDLRSNNPDGFRSVFDQIVAMVKNL
jgi:esterase/lipase